MEKLHFFVVFMILVLVGYSCNRISEQSPIPQDGFASFKIPAVLTDAKIGTLRLPYGTTTQVVNNGATVNFTFPKGVMYVQNGDFGMAHPDIDGGSYTCTGSCSKGCDVFYAGGSFGCSSCDPSSIECKGKAGGSISPNGGFINTLAGIKFISDKVEFDKLSVNSIQAPEQLFKYKLVKEAMIQMNRTVHGVDDPTQLIARNPKNYVDVAINLLGVPATYTVPISYLQKETARRNARLGVGSNISYTQIYLVDGEDAGFSCKCESGTKGCTADSGIGYKRCISGDCTSCTMTVN